MSVPHAVCVLEVAKGAQSSNAEAPVMVLAGLFKSQAGTQQMSPKALKVSSPFATQLMCPASTLAPATMVLCTYQFG